MWKDILKVDNIIFDKDQPPAFYNPHSKEITLNLTNMPTKGKTDEEIILDLEEVIIHESAHKATSSEIKHLTEKFVGEFADTFVSMVNEGLETGEIDASKLSNVVSKLLEIVSLDEAYAYSTGATVRRIPLMNIIESSVVGIEENLINKLIRDIMQQIIELYSPDDTMAILEALERLKRNLLRKMASKVSSLEFTVKQFVADMNKLTPDEISDYMIKTSKKIGMV
tara:strand:+ start:1140 stop:1814 length:675 start_codon:yes stop_codon:yes gene_type:complete